MKKVNKLHIKSDFRQYYDPFASAQEDGNYIFRRMMVDGIWRTHILPYLSYAELFIPTFGRISQVHISSGVAVVIYDSLMLHAGEGKRYAVPTREDIGKFYMDYIHSSPRSSSYRFLAIGSNFFYLHYASDDEWRSNCGNVTVNLLDKKWAEKKFPAIDRDYFDYPMFAIDFVDDWETGIFHAVDFNTAPGIDKTPIQDILSGSCVVDYILSWLREKSPMV